MRSADYLLTGSLLLAGLMFLLRSSDLCIRSGLVPRLKGIIIGFHERATLKIIEKGILRFPGVHLASPLRGWIAGETTFLAFILISMSRGISAPSAVLYLLSGLLLGVAVVALSIQEDAKKQVNGIRSALPLASFLLSLMLEAGMGSSAAMREVVKALPHCALSRELDEIARSRLLGISRENAIERSTKRVPLDEYLLFLNLIRQGERLGVGLSQGLRELSSRMMESQWHRAESLAQKAAVKLLFPLVIFIFPSVFLIVLSPVILDLFEYAGR
ncbi:MAG: type II secretion system F family protein [Deltaproteobacteria bacterium]|nr:type II secretion system F family protein [Deltaproteobacteria bacterium]